MLRAMVCVALLGAVVVGAAKNKKQQPQPDNVQRMDFTVPNLSEEEIYSTRIPEHDYGLRCEACALIEHQLYERLVKAEKHRKKELQGTPLRESTVYDVLGEACEKENFKGVGVRVVNSVKHLTGPGVKLDDMPGVDQTGGKWADRLGEQCEDWVGNKWGDEMDFYRVWHSHGDDKSTFSGRLCVDMARDCKTRIKLHEIKHKGFRASDVPEDAFDDAKQEYVAAERQKQKLTKAKKLLQRRENKVVQLELRIAQYKKDIEKATKLHKNAVADLAKAQSKAGVAKEALEQVEAEAAASDTSKPEKKSKKKKKKKKKKPNKQQGMRIPKAGNGEGDEL